jgi:hypothetical protein
VRKRAKPTIQPFSLCPFNPKRFCEGCSCFRDPIGCIILNAILLVASTPLLVLKEGTSHGQELHLQAPRKP